MAPGCPEPVHCPATTRRSRFEAFSGVFHEPPLTFSARPEPLFGPGRVTSPLRTSPFRRVEIVTVSNRWRADVVALGVLLPAGEGSRVLPAVGGVPAAMQRRLVRASHKVA